MKRAYRKKAPAVVCPMAPIVQLNLRPARFSTARLIKKAVQAVPTPTTRARTHLITT